MFAKTKLIKLLLAEVERKDKIIERLTSRIVMMDFGTPKEKIEVSGSSDDGIPIDLESMIGEVIPYAPE